VANGLYSLPPGGREAFFVFHCNNVKIKYINNDKVLSSIGSDVSAMARYLLDYEVEKR
jgi:hypothetical protein